MNSSTASRVTSSEFLVVAEPASDFQSPISQYVKVEDNSSSSSTSFSEMNQSEFENVHEGNKHTDLWGCNDEIIEEDLYECEPNESDLSPEDVRFSLCPLSFKNL